MTTPRLTNPGLFDVPGTAALYDRSINWVARLGREMPVLCDVFGAPGDGRILDAGCGTGDNALFFAQRGHEVLGIDFLDEAISRAARKAEGLGLELSFQVMDALAMDGLPRRFDNVIDCGLFHVFSDEDRPRYITSLYNALKPNGRLWFVCFSDKEPPGEGPRRISRLDIQTAFAGDWEIDSIDDVRFETAANVPASTFSEGGPRAYRALVRRGMSPNTPS